MKNKYHYVYIVQGCYDYHTWEDVHMAENYLDGKKRLREYRANEGSYSHRLIQRRVLNNES